MKGKNMSSNNEIHFIENANKILFELVTKLKDYEIDVKVSGNYEYSEDCTSLDFVEKIDELDFSKHDRKFTDRIKKLEKEIYKKQDEIDKLSKKNLNCENAITYYKKQLEECTQKNESLCQQRDETKKKISELESELSYKESMLNEFCGENGLIGLTPIEVAEKLINAEVEYETNSIEKAFGAEEKEKYNILSALDLKQIAEHLLVYCNHNSEEVG
jgi:chromosome segregation ATPase